MQEQISRNVLIEPSLLIAEKTCSKIISAVNSLRDDYEFYIPSKFLNLIYHEEYFVEEILFFRNGSRIIDIRHLKEILLKNEKLFRPYKVSLKEKEKHGFFYDHLRKEVMRDIISDVLFEEWVFLQEQSWIISRIKKPFIYFVKAGGAAIEIGNRTLKLAVRKSLKKGKDDLITNADKLRVAAKWIAASGSPFLSFINPAIGVIGSAVAGFFLLIDPENSLDTED